MRVSWSRRMIHLPGIDRPRLGPLLQRVIVSTLAVDIKVWPGGLLSFDIGHGQHCRIGIAHQKLQQHVDTVAQVDPVSTVTCTVVMAFGVVPRVPGESRPTQLVEAVDFLVRQLVGSLQNAVEGARNQHTCEISNLP